MLSAQKRSNDLMNTCRPGLKHIKPCGKVPWDDAVCACGCSAYEDYCMDSNKTPVLSLVCMECDELADFAVKLETSASWDRCRLTCTTHLTLTLNEHPNWCEVTSIEYFTEL
jgi:hypothetical protein